MYLVHLSRVAQISQKISTKNYSITHSQEDITVPGFSAQHGSIFLSGLSKSILT